LSGRFVVGRNALDINSVYNKAGMKGGFETVQLTENQIPRHSHGVSLNTNTQGHHSHHYVDALFPFYGPHSNWPDFGVVHHYDTPHTSKKANYAYRDARTSGSGDHMHSISGRTESTGANTAFDNRPPFYTVVYIVYKGTDVSPLVG